MAVRQLSIFLENRKGRLAAPPPPHAVNAVATKTAKSDFLKSMDIIYFSFILE